MRFALFSAVVVAAPWMVFACGDRNEPAEPAIVADPAPSKTDPPPPTPAVDAAEPAEASDGSGPSLEPPDDDPLDMDAAVPGDPKSPLGPCKIRWSNGATLRFTYTVEGGTVRVDHDRDGKADECGTFVREGTRITSLSVTPGCRKNEEIRIVPSYDSKTNVAEAQVGSDAITLVTLQSFVGLEPGYVLHAKRSAIKLSIRGGLVRSAKVQKPTEGLPLEAKFTYDASGRITLLTEDHELDGTIDRRLEYGYDESGRLIRMEVTLGQGDAAQKGSARLDYASCHPAQETPTP